MRLEKTIGKMTKTRQTFSFSTVTKTREGKKGKCPYNRQKTKRGEEDWLKSN